jgi:two-component system LytT family response regulator
MRRFRVLVVDDEPLAREVVVDLLRRDAEVAGVTETGDALGVPAMVETARPDIVFLDIEMPGLTGIEIASTIVDDLPAVVFVTAFTQYAVKAFDVEAIDYLLKPFSDERFFEALDRAKRRVLERLALAEPGDPSDPASGSQAGAQQITTAIVSRLAIGTGDNTLWIDAADVIWIEAEDYYVRLHTKRGRHLMRVSMSFLEERLDPRSFVRSHRRAIVNLREVSRLMDGASTLLMSDGAQVAISRSRRPAVERLLGSPPGAPR